jgi:diphthine-ammonia ligase
LILSSIEGSPFFCSWSGGKDSCLALYRAISKGGTAKRLLTMMTEDGHRSRSHGLTLELLEHQAEAMGIELRTHSATWDDYEATFIDALHSFKRDGLEHGVFGDIDMDPHLAWVQRVCGVAGIEPYEPLWKAQRRALLDEFLQLGFKATIIAIRQSALSDSFLGRTLDAGVITDLEAAGVDASGEEGEYHTVVTAGPIFTHAIDLDIKEPVVRDGYSFLDVAARRRT